MRILRTGLFLSGLLCYCGCRFTSQVEDPYAFLGFDGRAAANDYSTALANGAGVGEIVSVSEDGTFVVMEFAPDQLPESGSLVSIFREGQQVGTVTVTGPDRKSHTVGNISEGSIRKGDAVLVVIPGEPPQETPPSKSLLLNFGRVVSRNVSSNFVVLEFVSGNLPAEGSDMGVYREGERVGALRISGHSQNLFTTADIRDGTVEIGDEVRPD